MRVKIILALVFLIIATGCVSAPNPTGQVILSQNPQPSAEKLCKTPYFEFKKGECCLDSNANSICDNDEKQQAPKQPAYAAQETEDEEGIYDEEFKKRLPHSIDLRKEYAKMIDPDDHVLGNEKTQLTFIVFNDFECAYCNEFEDKIYPKLKSKYVDTGKAKIVFKHFQGELTKEGKKAAQAVECAGEQGEFWEMKDLLYKNDPDYSDTLFFDLANQLKLDIDDFRTCLESGVMQAKIDHDLAMGDYLVVEGTPALFINGWDFEGIMDWEDYEYYINDIRKWERENS